MITTLYIGSLGLIYHSVQVWTLKQHLSYLLTLQNLVVTILLSGLAFLDSTYEQRASKAAATILCVTKSTPGTVSIVRLWLLCCLLKSQKVILFPLCLPSICWLAVFLSLVSGLKSILRSYTERNQTGIWLFYSPAALSDLTVSLYG